jgi:acetyl-CoA carboxylase alpha subunit
MVDAWRAVELCRHPQRPRPPDFVAHLVSDWVPLRGDRVSGDDPALMAGVGSLAGLPVGVLAHVPGGNDLGPAGLRKALRLVRLAERFDRTVVLFVDVRGRHVSSEAMWPVVGEALERFMRASVPLVTVLCGEGVSGGALAFCVSDRLVALEYAYLAPNSPEAVSAIVWRDPGRAAEAAKLMRITSDDLVELGLCSRVIPEGQGAHAERASVFSALERCLPEELAAARAGAPTRGERFRRIGSAA